jgi:hypothetical protein
MSSLLETELEGRRITCFNVGGELRHALSSCPLKELCHEMLNAYNIKKELSVHALIVSYNFSFPC